MDERGMWLDRAQVREQPQPFARRQQSAFGMDGALLVATLNEEDGMRHAASILEDPGTVRAWRKNLEGWRKTPMVTLGEKGNTIKMDGAYFGQSGTSIDPKYGEWTAERAAVAVDALKGLPEFRGVKVLVALSPVYSLDCGGNFHGTRKGDYSGVIVIPTNASIRPEDTKNAVLHEYGHAVQQQLRAKARGESNADFVTSGEKIKAEYDAAVTGNKERREKFGVSYNTGRHWGGGDELFAEDFAHAYGGKGRLLGNADYGGVAEMDDASKARFRKWVEGALA